jgi:hypothetical protein
MDFEDYKDQLEECGYVVTSENITTRMGDVLAALDPYGSYWCTDSMVEGILSSVVNKKVRARTKSGHFIKDDPTTPENEAWVTEVVKSKKA